MEKTEFFEDGELTLNAIYKIVDKQIEEAKILKSPFIRPLALLLLDN